MSHRDLLVLDDDGELTTNNGYYAGRSPFDRVPEERIFPEGVIFARKKPVRVRALHYRTLEDAKAVEQFVGIDNVGPGITTVIAIWNAPENQWIDLPLGHLVMEGVQGEFYPCDPEIFAETYDIAGGDVTPTLK